MDAQLRRRFPDYAWPVIATLDDVRIRVGENLAVELDPDHAGPPRFIVSPIVSIEDVQSWARQVADEICDLLEVLKDPKPAPS
jgi:hypothetical protein